MSMNIQEMNNVAKQTIILFSYMDKKMLEKIPSELIEHLQRLAIDSNIKFKYQKDKDLDSQNLLDETKDLLSVIFYSYIASENEKKEILKKWNDNENKYNELLLETYKLPFDSSKNDKESKEDNALIINKSKGSLFMKIKQYINKIFK